MTPKAMGKLTLDEIEALVARAQKAANAWRDAQAVLGIAQPVAENRAIFAPRPPEIAPVAPGSPVLQTPERAEWEAQRAERIADQRAFLANAKNDPARAAMLAQFQGENGVES